VKFVCETSRLFTSKNEALASFLHIVAEFGGLDGDYVTGVLKGISGSNCSSLYATCEHSPLEKTFPFLLEDS